jgi:hypothetical protein
MIQLTNLSIANGLGLAMRYGVAKNTLSNWRARYDDFPRPVYVPHVVGIPLYRVSEVDEWRRKHNKGRLV